MSNRHVLRYYQRDGIDAVYDQWAQGVSRTLFVAPTGSGKSVCFSTIIDEQVTQSRKRPLVLVHRDELVRQAAAHIKRTNPILSVGVVQAGRHEVDAEVVVASIQTISRRLGVGRKAIASNRFDLIVYDEAHHAPSPTSLNTLRHFGAMDGHAVSVGFTATPSRADGIGLGMVWETVAYEYTLAQAIEEGYLVRPDAYRVHLEELDLSKVRVQRGDYTDGALGGAMIRSGERIAEAILRYGMDGLGRVRRGVTFAPTVKCAIQWAEDFERLGIRTAVVVGETPIEQRQATYRDVENHRIDVLVGVGVFLEGWDVPSVELVVMARPTKSQGLYIQAIGRGLRPSLSTGKQDCLVLDVCGAMDGGLVALTDLGIPDSCDCKCECTIERACAMSCNCPRTRSGKLIKHCLLCRKYGLPSPCLHYDRDHVNGCTHACGGPGRPGVHPDEILLVAEDLLPGESPEHEIDHSEINLKRVDLVGSRGTSTPVRYRRKTAWLTTRGGIPFLASTANSEESVFLWPDAGSWTVGVLPRRGTATRVEAGLSFADAVAAAQAMHPSRGRPGRPLVGPATEGQLTMLRNMGVEVAAGMSKQSASETISVALVSRSLDS